MSDDEPRKHRVGYRSPPLETRFVKGQSGNPKGRPKGARGYRNILREALDKKILIQDRDGRTHRKRTIDVIVQRDIAKALKGEDKALMRVQAQARVLDLEDESKAGARTSELSARDREILAHYAPDLLTPPAASPSPSKKEDSDEAPLRNDD